MDRLVRTREAHELIACSPVLLELLAGMHEEKIPELLEWYERLQYVEAKEPQDFRQAAKLYRRARKSGLTIRNSLDCLIAAVAIRTRAELLHNDRDFTHLARVCPLRLANPETIV
jgi:predicted nucleic acid-binding protein